MAFDFLVESNSLGQLCPDPFRFPSGLANHAANNQVTVELSDLSHLVIDLPSPRARQPRQLPTMAKSCFCAGLIENN